MGYADNPDRWKQESGKNTKLKLPLESGVSSTGCPLGKAGFLVKFGESMMERYGKLGVNAHAVVFDQKGPIQRTNETFNFYFVVFLYILKIFRFP